VHLNQGALHRGPPGRAITLPDAIAEHRIVTRMAGAGDAPRIAATAARLSVCVYDEGARELVLVKVRSDVNSRPEVLQIADIFRAKIVNLSPDSLIIEATGDDDKVTALLGLLEPFGIIELARTGRLALKR
jgi:hypothetical protein